MFRRYNHGHSAGLGFLLALALMQHALVFGLLTFAAGLVAGRAWSLWADVARAVKMRLLGAQSKREAVVTTPQPVYATAPARKPPRKPLDGTPFDGLD